MQINTNTMEKPKKAMSKKQILKLVDYHKLKFIDLCCGIGGFHYALQNLGHECVMASDINEKCGQIMK